MGLTHVNVTLRNSGDVELHRRHLMGEEEIRNLEIRCLVDTGAITMVINQEIQEALGLSVVTERLIQTADGTKRLVPVAGPLDIWYEDRFCTTNALVMPDDTDPLLGAIPLEEMDLWVHPATNRLTPIHPGEGPVMIVK
jgi:clan AA aspartic protease